MQGQARGGKYKKRIAYIDPKTGRIAYRYKYADEQPKANSPKKPDLERLRKLTQKVGAPRKEERRPDPELEQRKTWREDNADAHQTRHHRLAIPRARMRRDKSYTLWQRVGDHWVVERTFGGDHILDDDTYWSGIKDRSEGTRPLAFFQQGINPNAGLVSGVRKRAATQGEKPTQRQQRQPGAEQAAREETAETMTNAGYVQLTRKDEKGVPVTKWVHPDTKRQHDEAGTTHWSQVKGSGGSGEAGASQTGVERSNRERRDSKGAAPEKQRHGSAEAPEEVPDGLEKPYTDAVEETPVDREDNFETMPERDEGPGAGIVNRFRVSANHPPNFLGLRKENMTLKTTQRGQWTNYEPIRPEMPEDYDPEDYNHERLDSMQFLEHIGFWDVARDKQTKKIAHATNRLFASLVLDDADAFTELRGKAQPMFAKMQVQWTAWWTNLHQEYRQRFWDLFVDVPAQRLHKGKKDPRHEDGDFDLPQGMEKFEKLGFELHEYQKKAVNFLTDHSDGQRALWAMEMGLGKTLGAVAAFHKLRERGQVNRMIVTAPLSAHSSWRTHFEKFSDAKTAVMSSWTPEKRQATFEAFEQGKIDVIVLEPGSVGRGIEKKAPRLPGQKEEDRPPLYDMEHEDLMAVLEDKALGHLGEIHLRDFEGGEITYEYRTDLEVSGWYEKDPERDYSAPRHTSLESIGREINRLRADHKEELASAWDEENVKTPRISYLSVDSDRVALKRIAYKNEGDILRVADEVHVYKTPTSQRSRGFEEVMTIPDGPMIGMTGTPKPNGIHDFYYVCEAIKKGSLGNSLRDFGENYCYTSGKGISDPKSYILGLRPEELSKMYQDAAGLMFTRTISDDDVNIELPDRIDLAPDVPMDDVQTRMHERILYYMELKKNMRKDESGRYAEELYAAQSDDNDDPVDRCAARIAPSDPKVALLRMIQLAIDPSLLEAKLEGYERKFIDDYPDYESPKMAFCADAVMTHLSQNTDKNAVVFCEYNGGIEAFQRALKRRGLGNKDIGIYTGATSGSRRIKITDGLNEGKLKVLVGNTAALETGANLQERANLVVHLNTPWSPTRLTQSTGRVYRQGQRNTTTVLRPVGSEIEGLLERSVSRKIMESAQATGKATDADEYAARTMREGGKSELTASNIAEAMGASDDVFGDKDDIGDTLTLDVEKYEEKERKRLEKEAKEAAKRAAKGGA